jgi:hypothetical protein
MAPSFLPRRLCGPTGRADRARGGSNHSRRRPRDIRPSECWDCPVDISPTDILAQRQDFWVARPTLKAVDQEQSIAAVHHWTLRSSICGPYFCIIHCGRRAKIRPDEVTALSGPSARTRSPAQNHARPPEPKTSDACQPNADASAPHSSRKRPAESAANCQSVSVTCPGFREDGQGGIY